MPLESAAQPRTDAGLEEQNRRIRRALRTLSACNRTLLRETDEAPLLGAMCRVAVEHGGYRLALVNYALHDEAKTVRTMAHYGANDGFVESLALTWQDTERGRGSVGTAIRSGRPCVVHSTSDDPRFLPWREEALRRGLRSIISLPLALGAEVIGTFSLLAAEEDAFDAAELELLEELAADLSFGIGVVRDRARQREAEELVRRALRHDAITGLLNRNAFLLELSAAIGTPAVASKPISVLVLRLARVHEIYEGFGYEPGRAMLRAVARRLQESFAPGTVLARLQVDEFALVLPGEDARSAAAIATRLATRLQDPIEVAGVPLDVPATVGASFYPGHGDDAEILLRRATNAARESARRELAYYAYQGGGETEKPQRLALAAELRRAIAQGELELHYQPKLTLPGTRVVGCEALVRWRHPRRGLVPPAEFVSLAEETGLVRDMTYAILEQAVRQQHAWTRRGLRVRVAVNLSARNLHDPRLATTFGELLGTWGVDAGLIDFEITEGALVQDPDGAREALRLLRKSGSRIYIDDFGTGYSSLNYLVSLPVDALKVDRSFVRQMDESREAHAVVASIISMAHNLGLSVVAEGVETASEAQALGGLGCNEAQGYFFQRPAAAAQCEDWLARLASPG